LSDCLVHLKGLVEL